MAAAELLRGQAEQTAHYRRVRSGQPLSAAAKVNQL